MNSTIRVYLVLTGFACDPSEITARTALKPEKTWRMGEKKEFSTDTYKESGWRFSAQADSPLELERQIDLLIVAIEPAMPILETLHEEANIEIACMVFAYDHIPLHLSRTALNAVARLRAEIDIDLYSLPEEASPDES